MGRQVEEARWRELSGSVEAGRRGQMEGAVGGGPERNDGGDWGMGGAEVQVGPVSLGREKEAGS